MPKRAVLTVNDFLTIKNELERLGFREVGIYEFRNDFKRLGLQSPRKVSGREVGFKFEANHLIVKVWTSFEKKTGEFRKKDAGWVLICQGDDARYFSGKLHRTKNFVARILSFAWISKWKVEHRPLCPVCHAFMEITTGSKNPKSKYWSCEKILSHPNGKKSRLDWDHGITREKMPKAYLFLMKKRKKAAKYRAKLRKEGKPTDQAMFKRKKWKRKRPENAVKIG